MDCVVALITFLDVRFSLKSYKNYIKLFTGLAACFCYPCYQCYVTCQLHEEALCLIAGSPYTWMAVRAHIRGKFNIQGSICGDCMISHLCPCCVLCQVRNEWESRHRNVGVVIQQQAPIIHQTVTTTTQ